MLIHGDVLFRTISLCFCFRDPLLLVKEIGKEREVPRGTGVPRAALINEGLADGNDVISVKDFRAPASAELLADRGQRHVRKFISVAEMSFSGSF